MSSAFPQESQHNVFSPGAAAIPVPERGTHIPAGYVRNPHTDPDNTIVKQNGVPLLDYNQEPFKVSQVAPERRWAIYEDGELMPQELFTAAKQQGILEFYEMLKERGHPNARYEGKLGSEPIPAVHYYVRWQIDPLDPSKLIEIGYDPDATNGAVSEHFHDNKGDEIAASRLDVLCQAYASAAGRAQMTAAERQEVELHLGVSASAGTDGVAAKLEVLTELHKSGELSDEAYLDSVTKLTGAEKEVSEKKQPQTARCGKTDCKGDVGLKAHERKCKKCQDIAAEEEGDNVTAAGLTSEDEGD